MIYSSPITLISVHLLPSINTQPVTYLFTFSEHIQLSYPPFVHLPVIWAVTCVLQDLAQCVNEVKRDNEIIRQITTFQLSIENMVRFFRITLHLSL